MSKICVAFKAVGFAFGASVGASLAVLLIGMCVFGFQLAECAEWQGRIAGVVGTLAGIGGTVIGLQVALRAPPPPP